MSDPGAGRGPRTEGFGKSYQGVPFLYHLSFLHDLLNYATALLWLLAYVALMLKVQRERNAYGLSFQSLFALVWVEVSNVLLILCLLVYHNKPIHAEFFIVDCSSALISLAAFVYINRYFSSTYESQRDNFGKRFCRMLCGKFCVEKFSWLFLYFVAFVISCPMFLLRRSKYAAPLSVIASNGSLRLIALTFLSFWECFNDSVLALALVPQLFMFYNKRPRKVTNLLGTFVALLFFARICAFLYWLTFTWFHTSEPTGRGIHLLTEALNILILLDFLYHYIRAKLAGERDISLPI
ncbi:hypothetical protein TGME49_224800 [Toxoplasma gondii ME49]|uniref:ER lumen protein retaining receptor n=12 Tax=Toxoplasma gondii TaxID=5811 RepID=B9PM81_TOXGV|nr:hypothetical protein TGME49_224800 [Toxoplasma gondii ME49]EPR62096.1 hypothetical protein TGGT1_224800 [Toxoplasma gondii GT1]ESS32455.1 ER lumen protein retaining receptor [Toxoplasma gondii VEG]KAF4640518.1 hypothetical protein TGRH88_044440 [Toxoplasma gondii]KFG45622.1 ER lumen protein retaining receptor [Toxoplasma gondii GAB2-2007-GAL-DOM2]KFG55024.1 ER lumen protein retaining receptor [Toxoplasma gondii FOU]KFH13414.1 ER lumen protein retaining receptor [Toxoplasma gondii VAND]KFH|eukprot:XP_002366154.1 hypothetical protein TGME49_224800 [Toxoplasma gondii ME49]